MLQARPVEKLYHGVQIIRFLLKTCRTSTEETRLNNNKFLTFADYEVEEEVHSSTSFDTTFYKAKKEKTLSQEAIEVLRTNPKLRNREMLRIALLGLKSTVEAFGEFPINMQESLLERGWYEKFESKRTIIRQGHSALNFYLIISGITVVTVTRQNKVTGEAYSETVAFLKRGNSFGELALMFGGKRSATVSCKTDVELLAVSREDFIDIFMSVSNEGEPEHIMFLRGLPLLSQWPIDELPYDDPSICLFTYFRRGTVLCHDSNHGDWVYIIKSGTCRIIKNIILESKYRKIEDKSIGKVLRHNEYMSFLTMESLMGNNCNKKPKIPPAEVKIKQDINGKFYIQLKVLGVGSIFGMEPMAFEFVGGTTGVTLVSDGAELIAIERKFFQANMTRQYQSWLRKELQPFPSIKDLEIKLKNFYRWTNYKEAMIQRLINNGTTLNS